MARRTLRDCEIMAACYRIMAVLQTFSDNPQVFAPDTSVSFGAAPLHLSTFRAFAFRGAIESEFGLPDTGAFSVAPGTIRDLAEKCLRKRAKLSRGDSRA